MLKSVWLNHNNTYYSIFNLWPRFKEPTGPLEQENTAIVIKPAVSYVCTCRQRTDAWSCNNCPSHAPLCALPLSQHVATLL